MVQTVVVGGKQIALVNPKRDLTIPSRQDGGKYHIKPARPNLELAITAGKITSYVGSARHNSSLDIGTPITVAYEGSTLTIMPYARSDTNQLQLLVVNGTVAQVTGTVGTVGKALDFAKLYQRMELLQADGSVWQSLDIPASPSYNRNYVAIAKSITTTVFQQWHNSTALIKKVRLIAR